VAYDIKYADVALSAWKRHVATHGLSHYAGIVSLHALARLAKISGSPEILEELKAHIRPFWQGEVKKAAGIYGENVYRWGGNATAFMVLRGMLPEALEPMVKAAESLIANQPRDSRGIFHWPTGNRSDGSEGFLWIDTVFGVCPFLLWVGLAAERPEFIDESCFQMIRHHETLFDKSCRLYHQAINFNFPGALTPAHWSRGCGWGALALAEMAYDLPKGHKDYEEILSMFKDLMSGCRDHMDANGMSRQAVETPSTYAESSGTSLILYAMSRGLKNGSLPETEFKEPFLRGLKGIMRYIALDGSVFNCCPDCLAPGQGTAEDYDAKKWVLNDDHAFGPVMLLFGQAQQLEKIGKIPPLSTLLQGYGK